LEGLFLHKKALLKEALIERPSEVAAVSGVAEQQGQTNSLEEVTQERHQKHVDQYQQIQELFAKKVDLATIGRQVGVSRRTRVQLIEPFKPYLVTRWNEGCRNGQQMWREIMEQG